MNALNTYKELLAMLDAYDAAIDRNLGQQVAATPDRFAEDPDFYGSAARLLIDIRSKMDTASSSRSVLAAARRMIREAKKTRYTGDFAGTYQEDGKTCICDGYRFARLTAPLDSLPKLDKAPVNTAKLMDDALAKVGDPIDLPSVADIKAHIARNKADNLDRPYIMQFDNFAWGCNPQYLLDMLQILPNCIAHRPANALSPMLFECEDGSDGLLLPVRLRNVTAAD